MRPRSTLIALSGFVIFQGCSDNAGDPKPGTTSPTIAIAVAPLSLPGIGMACYDLQVFNGSNGTGETVWRRGEPGHQFNNPDYAGWGDDLAICSNAYGNASDGDIAFVGPCDADGQVEPQSPEGERANSVTVWFDGLYDQANLYIDPDGPNGWQDPCPNGCTLNFLCHENRDVNITFNFAVMRDAQQGFFDIAVRFSNIFCSAKYDTCYEPGNEDTRIELLYGDDYRDGPGLDRTGVLALACTGGPDGTIGANGEAPPEGGPDTALYYSRMQIVCLNADGPGDPPDYNVYALDGGTSDQGYDNDMQYVAYYGHEELTCDGQPCNKLFWNFAINLEDLEGNCSLHAQATAESSSDPVISDGDGVIAAPGTTHPFIDIDIKDVLACQTNPLNGADSNVTTSYGGTVQGTASAMPMCHRFPEPGEEGRWPWGGFFSHPVDTYADFASARRIFAYGDPTHSRRNLYGQVPYFFGGTPDCWNGVNWGGPHNLREVLVYTAEHDYPRYGETLGNYYDNGFQNYPAIFEVMGRDGAFFNPNSNIGKAAALTTLRVVRVATDGVSTTLLSTTLNQEGPWNLPLLADTLAGDRIYVEVIAPDAVLPFLPSNSWYGYELWFNILKM